MEDSKVNEFRNRIMKGEFSTVYEAMKELEVQQE